MTIKTLLPAAALGMAFAFGTAHAAPVTGGTTVVDVDIDVDIDTDITINAIDGATVGDDGLLNFGITGGDFDAAGLTGELFHAGGFEIVAVQAISITNLVIDVAQSTVFADVNAGGVVTAGVAAFTFDLTELDDLTDLFDVSDPSLSIFATAEFSAIFVAIFAFGIEGVQMGHVATNPVVDGDVIPLPGAAVLFGTVMAGAAARRKLKA